ncbi:hypothetical protein Val02_45300 [Virgisporangium aliadipatigenens]|uniref:Secreted protein n=1 Tax=Virgisporangium aliadipatigenens TaxID=741659 RepID=A0A8J3YLI2_9ACTN|nr:hypothetical protein Val02_45300 [Virgisporangium aliadipatigenens]
MPIFGSGSALANLTVSVAMTAAPSAAVIATPATVARAQRRSSNPPSRRRNSGPGTHIFGACMCGLPPLNPAPINAVSRRKVHADRRNAL